MPDNRNPHDNDSLLPDWLKDSDMSWDEPEPAPQAPTPPPSAATSSANASIPPWQQSPGQPPAQSSGQPRVAPPWVQNSAGAAPPPAAPAAMPPWGGRAPAADTGWAMEDDRAPSDADLPFDWDSSEMPQEPGGEIPRGLTSSLPWMEDAQPPQPSAAERAGLPDEPFSIDDLISEMEQERPAAPPPAPSLKDRLKRLSPTPTPPAPPPAQDAEWMSAFGQAAAYDQNTPGESDMEWLNAGTQPPPAEEDLSWLEQASGTAAQPPADESFGWTDETPQAEPEPVEEDLDWLDEPDFSFDDEEEAQAPESDLPDWLAGQAMPGDEPAAPEPPPAQDEIPDWVRQSAEPPPPPEPPAPPARGVIRRLRPPTPPPPPEPEESIFDEGLPDLGGLTYEEWERRELEREMEAQKTPEDRLLEEVPEWFAQLEGQGKAPEPEKPEPSKPDEPEFVPGWFLGLEDQNVEEAPDWFKKLDYSADILATNEPEPPEEPAAPAPPTGDLPDWFTGIDLPAGADWATAFGAPPAPPPEPPKIPKKSRLSPEPAAPPEQAPDWLAAEPELPMPDFDALMPAAPSEEVPDWIPEEPGLAAAAEETSGWLADESELSMADFDALMPAAPLEETPDWMAAEPGLAAAVEETSGWLADESELPMPDFDALMPAAPSEEVPDWMAAEPGLAAAAEETSGWLADESELPMPDFDALMPAASLEETPDWMADESALSGMEAEMPVEPGEMPDWLAQAAPQSDMMAEPEDIPFPELDLDQPMPETGEEVVEDWMKAFVPSDDLGAIHKPPRVEEPSEDFVERFDPGEVEAYFPPAASADSPDWLREMGPPDVPAYDEDFDREPPTQPLRPEAMQQEAELDWLAELSPDDLDLSALPEMFQETPPPEPARLPAESEPVEEPTLDSSAIDQLLGLYTPPTPPEPEVEPWPETAPWEAEPESELAWPEESEPAAEEPFEVYGVRTEPDELPDLETLLVEGVPDEPLFSEEPLFPEEPVTQIEPPAPHPVGDVHPEWVTEMRPIDLPVTVKAGGAQTNVAQKQVLELPDRLRALREAAIEEVEREAESAPAPPAGPLAGIAGALPPLDVLPVESISPVKGLVLNKDQQVRVARLQAMLELGAAEEAEEALPEPEGLLDEELPEPTPKARTRRRTRLKLDRVLITLLLLVGIAAPFVTDQAFFADDPPALSGDREKVGQAVDQLQAGDYVLFAFEYGPTAAGELDPLAEAVLRDVLAHNAIPLTISTNPAGALHAQAVVTPLVEDGKLLAARGTGETSLLSGEDYVTLRYLSGEAVGVRSLRNTYLDEDGNLKQSPVFDTDLRGDKTDLSIGDIESDLALLVVIGEGSENVRTWAEQLRGVTLPRVALVTAAVEPLTLPYVNEDGYAGYLAGYRDTYSYNAARNTATRDPYELPDDIGIDLPNPETSRWHSMALGAAVAASLITLGMVVNLFRALIRRRR